MQGEALLDVPESGVIGRKMIDGLPDDYAYVTGRALATTLSEDNRCFVIVTLTNGHIRVIGHSRMPHIDVIRTLERVMRRRIEFVSVYDL